MDTKLKGSLKASERMSFFMQKSRRGGVYMSKLKIEYMNIDKLIPYINNPRLNDGAVDKVASSIKNFGFKNPIIIDKDNEIIAGHTRLKAARKLGLDEVPTIKVEDLTDNQIKAFRIADNKTSELAEWDMELLGIELEGLEGIFTGFDDDEFTDIIGGGTGDVVEDNFEGEVPDAPISKKGDVWLLGEHRVMCGDSTGDDVLELVDGAEVDLFITDPPYNVDYTGGTKDALTIQNDNMADEDFKEFLVKAFTAADKVMKPGAAFYIWHADSQDFRGACRDSGWQVRQCLIWVKNSLVIGRQDYQWKHEPCLYGWKDGASHNWYGDRKQTTTIEDNADIVVQEDDGGFIINISTGFSEVAIRVPSYEVIHQEDSEITTIWRFDKPRRNGEHPTMKPVGLLARAVKNSSKREDIVLDLFGGSGSTLIACEQLDRICYMMELDEKYVDVIVNRYISFKESDEDVFLIRDGEKISYKDII